MFLEINQVLNKLHSIIILKKMKSFNFMIHLIDLNRLLMNILIIDLLLNRRIKISSDSVLHRDQNGKLLIMISRF